jgi:hypothetical protein
MFKTGLKYGAGLIALYLGVFYATGSGTLLTSGGTDAVNLVQAFQGR